MCAQSTGKFCAGNPPVSPQQVTLELPDRQPDETAVEETAAMASIVHPPCDSQVPPTLVSSPATTVPGKPDLSVNTPPEAVVETMPTPSPPAKPATEPAPPAVLESARERALTATVLEETEPGDSVSNAAGTPYDPSYWRPQQGY